MEKTTSRSFTIPDDIAEKMAQFCFDNDLSKSEVVLASILHCLPLFNKYPVMVKDIIHAEAQQSYNHNRESKNNDK